MSRRLDGGTNGTAICQGASVWSEAPALPAPEQDGRA
jgi:hypothetical protein